MKSQPKEGKNKQIESDCDNKERLLMHLNNLLNNRQDASLHKSYEADCPNVHLTTITSNLNKNANSLQNNPPDLP